MPAPPPSEPILRVGVLGLGRAFAAMAASFKTHPLVRITEAYDPRPEPMARCAAEFGARAAKSEAEIFSAEIDAVYIATPHQYHRAQALAALKAGKHVLIEKPLALSLEDGAAIVAAERESGKCVIVGHTHGFDPPVRLASDLIAKGVYGSLRMITALNYTDFLYRPRRPEELQTAQGGGVIFNQAPHQVDIVRMLANEPALSVSASTGTWDMSRPTEGAYTARVRFKSGAVATLIYSGYAHFMSDALMGGIGENGAPQATDKAQRTRARLKTLGATGEADLRARSGYETYSEPGGSRLHQHFGLIVASCDRADLRVTPEGVAVDSDDRQEILKALTGRGGGDRACVLDELYDAAVHNRPSRHNAAWGMATLEICRAMLDSAKDKKDIALRHQEQAP